MKWLLSIAIVFGLTSSTLDTMTIENQLLNEKWMLIESKSKSDHHQFTNKHIHVKNENLKTSLIFKENGVLIERHGPETDNPFFISDWKFVKEKQMLKISSSRHWNGLYTIDHLDKHSLRLVRR
jgi:hypothetical protein